MPYIVDEIRENLRLLAANFVVASGVERTSNKAVSCLWSGPQKQYAYFQERIFGSNPVSLRHAGRRPLHMLDHLLSKHDCSFATVVLRQPLARIVARDSDFCLPLWIDCEIALSSERLYAKSVSMRDELRKIRKYELTWQLAETTDALEFFYERAYLPTVSSSHGSAVLPASKSKRLKLRESGELELINVLRDGRFIAGITIDYRDETPTLRDIGVLDGAAEIKRLGAITAANVFAMDYLAKKGHGKVRFGLSRSFLDDGVLNYKRKFTPVVRSGSRDCVLLRIRRLEAGTRSMLRASACVSWQHGRLHRTYFRDLSDNSGEQSRRHRSEWQFGIDPEAVFDVSGPNIRRMSQGEHLAVA